MKTIQPRSVLSKINLTALVMVIIMVFAGCSKNSDDFVAVSDITDAPAVAEVDKPLQLTATVSPSGATNKTIVWVIKDAGKTGASITGTNVLTATSTGSATVTATIANGATETMPFTKDFTISVRATGEIPVVTGVTVTPSTANVAKDRTHTFAATVAGTKLEETDYAVNWTVTGGTKTETVIDTDGTLTIAEDETAVNLTVKATSILDKSKSGTASITVIEKPDDGPKAVYFGTWRVVVSVDGDNAFWEQITISADKAVWLNKNGYGCTMSGLTWTETNNPGGSYTVDYPEGYKVTGIMKMTNGYDAPKASGSGNAAVGDVALNSYYFGTDQQSIMVGNYKTAGQEAQYGPYIKKLNAEYWQVTWNLNGGTWPANDNHATQAAKDGKLAAPKAPTKTGEYFDGWYKESSLTNKVNFPYDASSVTGNFTLYAKWLDTPPIATLKITVSPGAGFYTSLTVMGSSRYNIPTSAGTHTVQVSPGTYRIYYSYMSCPYVSCSSAGYSSYFTVSSGQTKNISVVGSAVGF